MKKIFLIAMLCIASTINAQTLGYNDIGVLFSKEKINGTARFNAMSGAFGALGGDISAMEINPAGKKIKCSKCSASVEKHSLHCPKCNYNCCTNMCK